MLNVHPPLWAIVSSSIVALPVILYAQTEFRYWKAKRKAESLGARLAPKVPYKWTAGIDLIVALVNVYNTGYLGQSRGPCVPFVRISCGNTR